MPLQAMTRSTMPQQADRMSDPSSNYVARARAGDSSAFDELVLLHRPGIVRFIDLLIWDADEAESLAQETLTRAFAQLAEFQMEMRFGAWLRGIALNLCRNHLRNCDRRAKPAADQQLAAVPAPQGKRLGVLSGILRHEMADQLDEAIRLLPEALREAFVLHACENLAYDEIGQLLHVSPGTARVRAHRARLLLRDRLGSVVDTWYREHSPDESRS
jgi:RNA polymerase sigma-70 factor (ECF subfamily)